MEQRETRYRVIWYYKLFEQVEKGLGEKSSLEFIHGSLLALGELLMLTGAFQIQAVLDRALTMKSYLYWRCDFLADHRSCSGSVT